MVNVLIKRNQLVKELSKKGIKRANKKALSVLEKALEDNLARITELLVRELTLVGRKTLTEKDVRKVLERLEKKEEFWEV